MTPEKATERLFESIRFGMVDVAKADIDSGADVNARDEMRFTPLYAAILHRKLALVKLLVENGADVNARLLGGGTMLHQAVASDKDGDIVRVLIENGADRGATDDRGDTPLDAARKFGTSAVENVLKEATQKRPTTAAQGIYKTGKRQWVATLPPDDDDKETGRQ
jgi:ankyrin repeat protein